MLGQPQLVVVGAGAMGMLLAARLQSAGAAVWLQVRPGKLDQLASAGAYLLENGAETHGSALGEDFPQ